MKNKPVVKENKPESNPEIIKKGQVFITEEKTSWYIHTEKIKPFIIKKLKGGELWLNQKIQNMKINQDSKPN